jgi:glycosyltransferase involved in cell wall biosynthesis
MRVLCLTFGDAATASTFYRIHQYQTPLADQEVHLEAIPARQFRDWNSIQTFDAVLVQKSLLSTSRVRQLRRAARRLLYDVDDAIWHPQGKPHFLFTRIRQNLRLCAIARAADQCLAANGVLAAHLKRFTPHVAVVPMALDGATWKPPRGSPDREPLRIGWSGHPVNLSYLESIEPALLTVQRRFPKIEIAIGSGQSPQFRELNFVHLPFVRGKDLDVIQSFDIGLLPLPDNAFSAGKSPIKGLQYLACGVPSIATPLAGARELLGDKGAALYARSTEDWVQALARLIEHPEDRRHIAIHARQRFETCYELRRTTELLNQYLRGR